LKFLHLLWRNIMRKKVRTTFTFLSIVVAFFLFGLLMAVSNAFQSGIDIAGQDRLLTIHKVSLIQLLPVRYNLQIEQVPGVAGATHATWFGGIYQDKKNFFAQIAVDPEPYLETYPEYVLSAEQREAFIRTRTGAIAGRKVADRFGWKLGDKVPIMPTFWRPRDGGIDTYTFDLVGIYEGSSPDVDETQFFFHNKYLMERTGDPGMVGWYIVRVEDPQRADEVADAIDARFANSPTETKTTTEKAFMQGFMKQIGDTGSILSAIASIVFFVILLIAANTMAQAVRERTNELGVLKTLGFTDAAVLLMVMAESVIVALLGGVLGLTLIWLLSPSIYPLVQAFLPVFYVPTSAIVLGLVFAVALGVVSGALPAWTASRLKIVEALRRS
jgi:putative ABC transport system permease protein